ncbi:MULTISPECIES: zeta toxin family protein [Clostridium]|uniref:zeta toxin family protein n=1 Tax=Clostridium TaxID=1485 RepID=UPI00055D72BF|nr:MULTISPECIES: zeta toxin family protein [Clostridium]AXB87304.1 ATPase [Clostridium butyricum]MBC2426170.1 ATPase [Clostridium butyricum]MDB2139899.1 zeta toxin family protein [Clostridium butyricum]MDB2156090.1 zeta toxin family protein [Clostridium butyricum]MDU1070332.1 zeta toxin family protein [Clostridium sp.]
MKTYTIFAGVNGAGKTSIYKSVYYNENKDEKRINTDEMVARIGSWKDNNLQIKCAREAVKLIREYLIKGISFNQETTLSGKSIIRNIMTAKEKGFYVVMNYIGVDSPETAKERVKIRVRKGGHGISDSDIERRYYESLNNIKEVIGICDEISIYDNTDRFREIMDFQNGILVWADKNIPKWAEVSIK